jgi:phage tail-like protein
MGAVDGTKIGMSNRFKVVVIPENHDLGTWSKVDGLTMQWDIAKYQAGDLGNTVYLFPGNTKFSDVSLARTACEDSKKVKEWLDKTSFEHSLHDVTIQLYDESYGGKEGKDFIMSWTLVNAVPTKWSVVGFDAGKSGVAIETLTLAHSGFLNDEKKV